MAILAECPVCHGKQAVKNKQCRCGENLDRWKKNRRIRFHVVYRLNGKQVKKSLASFKGMDPYSLEDARKVEAKYIVAREEKRLEVFDIKKEDVLSFQELSDWYTETILPVRAQNRGLKDTSTIRDRLHVFNKTFGDRKLGTIKKADLEAYQARKRKEGLSDATIDQHIKAARQVVKEAFKNGEIGGESLRNFENVDLLLRAGQNARERILTVAEYLRVLEKAPPHLKAALTIAMNTGMRQGEIRLIRWSYIDKEQGFIRLPAEVTKEKRAKVIPINHHVRKALRELPRALRQDNVITYQGMPIRQKNGFKRSLATACEKAGVAYGSKVEGGFTFRDIRRTVKTNMVQAGIAKEYRDTILGHTLQGMDRHYIKPSEESLADAMERYTAWLDEKIEGVTQIVTHEAKNDK
jgi:integrase